jgi:hypothetical protein
MPTINISFTATNQIQCSRGLFSLESPGTQFTKTSGTGGGTLSIVTVSLPNALVGQSYSATLAATGGSGIYNWNIVSATPNTDLWLRCANSALYGIPELTELESITLQVTDTLGNTAQANLNLQVTVSGALSVATPSGQTVSGYYQSYGSVSGSLFCLRMLAQGGQPPYFWAFSGPNFSTTGSTTGTNYALTPLGWLQGAPTGSGLDVLTALCTDANGASFTQQVNVLVHATALYFYPLDLTNVVPTVSLPPAFASTSYLTQLLVGGGTGTGQTFAITAGVLPAGLSLSPSGVISGIPGSAGNLNSCQVSCTDSANNVATAYLYMNVSSVNKVARPSYNTGTGFFVDANGYFRDPSGYLFQFRGFDRAHYDASSWANGANGAIARPGVARTLYFVINAQTTTQQMSNALTQNIANNIMPVFMAGYFPDGTGTSGNTSTPEFINMINFWISGISGFTSYMSQIVINIANEWGSQTSGDPVWENTYKAVIGNISGIAGTTITVNTVSGSNPFANCPFAYILGAGGITNQVVALSAPGGSSGAWTVTSGTSLSGYTSGGTLNGGAVGALRAAGYSCPLMIDTNASGEDPTSIIDFAATINSSDPQKNCIFAHHSYHCGLPFQGLIASVQTGATTVLTLTGNTTYHPLAPFGGTNSFANQLYISGAQSLTQLNGLQAASTTLSGSQNNWQVTLNVNSTAWTGAYVANSATVVLAATTGQSVDYRYLYSQFAALRTSGVCVAIMESGPGNQTGTITSTSSAWNDNQYTYPGQVISAAEANGIPWCQWAWDDHNNNTTEFVPQTFTMTFGNNGVYTGPLSLTAFGLDVVGNPRYGLWALSQPAAFFLPTVFELTDQSGNLLIDQSANILTG